MADKRGLVDDPLTAHRKMLRRAAKRYLRNYEDMSHASEPAPKEDWTERRKKVWSDANKPTAEAPIYLKATMDFAAGFFRAEAERAAPTQLGVVVLGTMKSLEDWQEEARQVEAEGQRPMIEAEVVEDKK